MLKLKEILNSNRANITFDPYIPINIEFESWENKKEQHIYWRVGNFLEIGINPTNEKISSITLITISKLYNKENFEFYNHAKKLYGSPSFEKEKLSKNSNIIEDSQEFDFEFCIKNNSAIIIFTPITKIEFKLISENIIFGFNQNEILSSIEIQNISKDNKQILDGIIKQELRPYQ